MPLVTVTAETLPLVTVTTTLRGASVEEMETGVTKPIELALEFNGVNPGMGRGEVAGFTASVVLNRKDFGIGVDMPLETGGVVVGEKVTITLELEALKQA